MCFLSTIFPNAPAHRPLYFLTSPLSKVDRGLITMRPGEGFPSSKKDNSANFSGEKNYNEAFRGVYFCKVRKKPFQ